MLIPGLLAPVSVLIVEPQGWHCTQAFYRKEQPAGELDSFIDSQSISAGLSCVVNYISQSPSTTEPLCLCIKGREAV